LKSEIGNNRSNASTQRNGSFEFKLKIF
jgi:hypothetical protein